jgi:PhoD-like phosphatase
MAMSKLIAGPILRRVDRNKVSVWAAFNGHYRMTLKIWQGDKIKHDGAAEGKFVFSPAPLATGERTALRLGPHLSVGVVTAEIPGPGLQNGEIYSYNLIFEDSGDETETPPGLVELDLRTEGMLKDGNVEERPQKALGYANDTLPSFVLPAPEPEKLIIAHGSCRKMHGYGPDALSFLDDVIKKSVEEVDPVPNRPQQLFLTGDQIYADEVPGLMLRYAGNADGTAMMGPEKVRFTTGERTADTVAFPPYTRTQLTQNQGGFSSTAAANHLVTFSEFCGAYLNYWSIRSWNNQMWEKIKGLKTDGKIDDEKVEAAAQSLFETSDGESSFLSLIQGLDTATRNLVSAEGSELRQVFAAGFAGDVFAKWKKNTLRTLRDELKQMSAFADTLPLVSRVLANIPTYMIFDDHEITDDWYITQRWKNQTLGAAHPLGRDIIRNGMMAYAVFQDWGNVPDEYEFNNDSPTAPARTRLYNQIREYGFRHIQNHNLASLRADVIEPIEGLLGLGAQPAAVKWHYRVKTGPATTFVLDTRTRRQYVSLNAPPSLLTQEALNDQLPLTPPEPDAPFIIVVAPAPVLGLSSFEELIQPAAASVVGLFSGNGPNPSIIGGQIEFDYEAWGFNTAGFERLLDRLNVYKKAIILSGDVHYGFSSVLDYWKGTPTAPSARMIQLTASSLKNMRFPSMEFLKSGIVQRILSGFDGQLAKVGWKDKTLGYTNAHLITARNRARLRKATAVVPTAGWDTAATVNQPPDFRWRLRVVGDDRHPEGQPEDATDINLTDANSLREGYKKVVEVHQAVFKSGKNRRIAWPCNMGLIKFSKENATAPIQVQHEIIIAGSEGGKIQHKISMAAAAGAESARPELGT